MKFRRSTVGTCVVGVLIAGGWAAGDAMSASAVTKTQDVSSPPSIPGVTVGIPEGIRARHPSCNWRVWHKIDRYTSWRYVSPLLAQEFHVGACSKVISGTDGSVIFNQRGYVVEAS